MDRVRRAGGLGAAFFLISSLLAPSAWAAARAHPAHAATSCAGCHAWAAGECAPGQDPGQRLAVAWGPDAIARASGASPTWNAGAHACSGVYCHGATLAGGSNTSPVWTTVDGTQAACGTCHGLPPPPASGHPAATGLTSCAACHPDTVNGDGTIKAAGGKHVNGTFDLAKDCSACHADLIAGMHQTSGGHHHYLSSGYLGIGPASSTAVYPTAPPTPSLTDENRRCLMCHVEHDLFRPAGASGGGRGMNLRTDIALAPSATENLTNTDFDAALPSGGICVSCHQGALARAYLDAGGSASTRPIDKDDYAGSAHSYASVTSTFPAPGAGQNQFVANCSKCHSDTLAKRYQGGGGFGLHDSALSSMLTPVNLADPAAAGVDPLGDVLCLQCHRRSTDVLANAGAKPLAGKDVYGGQAMSPASELVYPIVSGAAGYRYGHLPAARGAASAHAESEGSAPADGSLSGARRHVHCADCHDPHAASPVGGSRPGTVTSFSSSGTTEVWVPDPDHAPSTAALRCGGALDVLTDAFADWPVNGRVGWTVKITSGPGAGSTSTIFANGTNSLSVKFDCGLADPNPSPGMDPLVPTFPYLPAANPPPAAGSTFVVLDRGVANGGDWDGPTKGAWGLEPVWPIQPSPPNWNDFTGAATGAPFRGSAENVAGPLYASITSWGRTSTPRKSGSVCIKCHSSYAYGSNPPSTPSGTPNVPPPYLVYGGVGWVSTEFSNTPGAAVPQSDLADQFNPNNLSHHAVFARGKNQPMISSDTVKSALNPSWPRFIGNGATVYVDVDGLDVTLRGTTWPSTVLPGWFIYIGASNPGFTPGHDSSRPFAGNGYDQCIGGKVVGVLGEDPYHCYWANDCLCVTHVPDTYVMAGWYEVTAVVDGTHLKLNGIDAASGKGGTGWRFRSPGTLRNQKFVLTAGLANAFVPPWGPWSTLQCFDCHSSDGSGGQAGWAIGEATRLPGHHVARPAGPPDPFGPHGSGTKWSLTNLTLKTYPTYVGYGSDPSEVVTVTQTWRSSPLPSATNMCLNCHRWEVYGDHNQGPATLGLGLTAYHFSRVDHPPHNAGYRDNDGNPDPSGMWANHPYGNDSKWGISCMTCHGGARSGGIHGQNVGHGSVFFGNAGSYSGRRMLAGSMLAGVTRPSTTETGLCNLKVSTDAVDYAGGGFSDNPHMYVWVPGMGMANYDFESGADP